MTRKASLVLAIATALGLGAGLTGCDKPTPDRCRAALLNMQHILGTENLNTNASLEGEVRRCRGGSKKTAVECAIKATTLDELRACDFEKVPGKAPLQGFGSNATMSPTPGGSAAAAPAGSAAAPPVSAVPAPGVPVPTGSAAPAATGSAAGSAH